MITEAYTDLLRRAAALGGHRLVSKILLLSRYGAETPYDADYCLSKRWIGRKTISQLRQLGVVKQETDHLAGLSTRSYCTLHRLGIFTKESAKQAIIEGRLLPKTDKFGASRYRNYGWKSYVEICKWAGFKEPQKAKRVINCPHCGVEIRMAYPTKLL